MKKILVLGASSGVAQAFCRVALSRGYLPVLAARNLAALCPVLFSPSYRDLPAVQLAEWILRDRLPVRFQTQLHKQLWGEKPGV